jgi:uncharacterized protein (TIGR04255 family)
VPRPVLPNSPLVEVVFELRFPGNLSLLGSWGALQQALLGQYPKLLVPGALPGVAPLLQHLLLANGEGTDLVQLAVNSFGFSTKRYRDFATFRASFAAAYEAFQRFGRVSSFTRLGLRYINRLPPDFPGERARGQLHPCLRLRLDGPDGLPATPSMHPQLIYGGLAKGLTLRIALEQPASPSSLSDQQTVAPGVHLDFDCSESGALPETRVAEFLEQAHEVIDGAFFGIITDDYRRFLEGDV